ncbi:hypothetical protein BGZ95_003367, partial [Linnemannia exigua]
PRVCGINSIFIFFATTPFILNVIFESHRNHKDNGNKGQQNWINIGINFDRCRVTNHDAA